MLRNAIEISNKMTEEVVYISVSDAIKWLKDHGIWNHLVNLGRAAAIELCSSYFNRQTCTNIFNSI